MSPEIVVLTIKGIGMLLLIGGGIFQIDRGYKLYKDGIGTKQDEVSIKFGELELGPRSIGSVLMSFAVLWAGAAVLISPNYEKSPDVTRIYSFSQLEKEIVAPELKTKTARVDRKELLKDPEKLKEYLARAYAKIDKSKYSFKINNVPGSLDLMALKAETNKYGDPYVKAKINSSSGTAYVTYKPIIDKKNILFVPSNIQVERNVEELRKQMRPNKSMEKDAR